MGPDDVCLLEFKSVSNAYCHNSTLKAVCQSPQTGDEKMKCDNLFGKDDPDTDEDCDHVIAQNYETFSAIFKMRIDKGRFPIASI